jgi:hypothetical protein
VAIEGVALAGLRTGTKVTLSPSFKVGENTSALQKLLGTLAELETSALDLTGRLYALISELAEQDEANIAPGKAA